MLRVDDNGWLASDGGFPEIRFSPTVRKYNLDDDPLGHVSHTTDTSPAARDESLADRIRALPGPDGRAASFHDLIGRNGTIQVCAPFTVGTWHVGKGGTVAGRAVANVNRFTIGTELANAGRLVQADGRFYVAGEQPSASVEVPAADVVEVNGRFYERFPDAQQAAWVELVRALEARFHWGRAGFEYGHVDFDPDRKQDQWPLWRTQLQAKLLDEVFGG